MIITISCDFLQLQCNPTPLSTQQHCFFWCLQNDHIWSFLKIFEEQAFLRENLGTRLFPKYHNALNYFPSKILSEHCFHFLLVLTIVPIETEKYSYAKFWRENKEYFAQLLPTTLSFPSDRTCTCSTSQQPRMEKAMAAAQTRLWQLPVSTPASN